jgi:hypothetical protein
MPAESEAIKQTIRLLRDDIAREPNALIQQELATQLRMNVELLEALGDACRE